MINLQQSFYSVRNEHLVLSQSSSLDNASVHTGGSGAAEEPSVPMV